MADNELQSSMPGALGATRASQGLHDQTSVNAAKHGQNKLSGLSQGKPVSVATGEAK